MDKITISIYRYFKSHKIVFYILLLSTVVFFTFFALKINFEEDVTSLLPSVKEGGAEKLVFSSLKVKDKIFILFNPTSDAVGPDELANACDHFVQSLLEKDTVHHAINNIMYQTDEKMLLNAVSFLFDHIPSYLDSSHYQQLSSILEKEQIEKQMGENYSLLRSPAGMVYRNIIPKDPVGILSVLMEDFRETGSKMRGNFAYYNNHIFTPDTAVALAFLSPSFKSFDSKQGIFLTNMIEKEIESFRQEYPGIEVLFHGAPLQSVYNSRQVKKDLLVTVSVSLAIILTILLACYKNRSTILFLLSPVAYGVIFALSVLYFIKGSMSLMAIGIGAIVMGVAFSYCLHVITHYKYLSDPEVVLKEQTFPLILGALTTIGAFAGLLFTESELLQDFGLFALLGLVGTTVFCLLFLPQFFRPEKNRKSEKAFALLERINAFPFDKQKWLIALILIVSAVSFVFSDKVRFDSDLRNIGYEEGKVVRSRQLFTSKTTKDSETVYFASVSGSLDSALVSSRRLSAKLERSVEKGEIKSYSSPASFFIPADEQQRRIDRWNAFWTENRKEEVKKQVEESGSKYRFTANTFAPFFRILDTGYKPVSLYDAGVIPEETMANIIEYSDNRYLVFTPVQMDRKKLIETGNSIVGDDPDFVVIDPMYYASDMVQMMHDDFNTTLAVSSLFVLVALLLFYRNIPLALIAFLPMGLSWYIVLGTMAFFNLEFNLINIIISAFIFGIGVDYSIFVMDGLLGGQKKNKTLLTYHKTAIFLSAVILIIATTSLLFAVHPAIKSIGIATLIGMGSTILIAYTLLPFLFSLLVKYKEKRKNRAAGLKM